MVAPTPIQPSTSDNKAFEKISKKFDGVHKRFNGQLIFGTSIAIVAAFIVFYVNKTGL